MQHKLGKRDPSARIAPLLFRPADVATARAAPQTWLRVCPWAVPKPTPYPPETTPANG